MYAQPRSIDEAVSLLAEHGGRLLAGGTDIYPAHVGRPLAGPVISLRHVPELQEISDTGQEVRIGAAVTWRRIATAPLPEFFIALQQAAREVGSIQVQTRGTIGGNLCNASPAADGVPPLLAMDAAVELLSPSGRRRLPLAEFITGYRSTALGRHEMLAAIIIPNAQGRSAFVKLGARRYLVISVLMAAACIEHDEAGVIRRARIAIGAASPVAQRLSLLEGDLIGLPPGTLPSSRVTPAHVAQLTPISDVRASADYRRDAALAVVGAALDQAAGMVSA